MAPRDTATTTTQRALLSRQRRQQRLDEFLVCLRCGGEAQLLGGTPGIGKLHGEVVAHDGLGEWREPRQSSGGPTTHRIMIRCDMLI